MRRPSPHFTTAFATRKATTTSSTLEFAKPAKALAGSTVPVSTTAPTASSEAVRSGNAFTMTEKIAAANTANRCQASLVSPAGTGANQMPNDQGACEGLFAQLAAVGCGCIHRPGPPAGAGAAWPSRARPLRSTTRPLTAPSSASTTYCHWNV